MGNKIEEAESFIRGKIRELLSQEEVFDGTIVHLLKEAKITSDHIKQHTEHLIKLKAMREALTSALNLLGKHREEL